MMVLLEMLRLVGNFFVLVTKNNTCRQENMPTYVVCQELKFETLEFS